MLDEVVVQQIQTQMAGAAQALQRAERDLVGMGRTLPWVVAVR